MKLERVAGRMPTSLLPQIWPTVSGAGGETSQVGIAYSNTRNPPGVLVGELRFFPMPETGARAGGWAKAGWRRRGGTGSQQTGNVRGPGCGVQV